jgi:hypothetical protein
MMLLTTLCWSNCGASNKLIEVGDEKYSVRNVDTVFLKKEDGAFVSIDIQNGIELRFQVKDIQSACLSFEQAEKSRHSMKFSKSLIDCKMIVDSCSELVNLVFLLNETSFKLIEQGKLRVYLQGQELDTIIIEDRHFEATRDKHSGVDYKLAHTVSGFSIATRITGWYD